MRSRPNGIDGAGSGSASLPRVYQRHPRGFEVPFVGKLESLCGIERGRIKILGDIINVEYLWDEWEAETDPDRVLNP